jgi:hypothetical protein
LGRKWEAGELPLCIKILKIVNMKRKHGLNITMVCGLLLAFTLNIFAQDNGKQIKISEKDMLKSVKKQTKEKESQGFMSKGAETIEMCLIEEMNIKNELNSKGKAKYIVVRSSSTGTTYASALAAAKTNARNQAAQNIQTVVSEEIKNKLLNNQISTEEAEGYDSTITTSKQIVAGKVSMKDIYIFYKEDKNEKDKPIIKIDYCGYYSTDMVLIEAEKEINKQLEEQTASGKGSAKRLKITTD